MYRQLRQAIDSASSLINSSRVQNTLAYWDSFGFEYVGTETVFLISTTLLQAVMERNLSLTISREYYSLCFDWWQQRDFAQTNYMSEKTFLEFSKMLWLGVEIPLTNKTDFVDLHQLTIRDIATNHKQIS